ncbi:MAG TPA: hypothetical protein PK771_07620 [Spirochaetota bacterium]|nr:hypothetical protein [Spirochaetota bacterium]
MKNIIKIILIINIFLITSCATLEKRYAIDGNLFFTGKKDFDSKIPLANLYIWKDKDGKQYGEFYSGYIGPAILVGELKKDLSGDMTLYINKIKYTTSWPNGFTEGVNEASGVIKFVKDKEKFQPKVIERIEFWELKKGTIRYFDDYYVYDEGLEKVKNRMVRIKSIVEYLKTLKDKLPVYFGNPYFNTKDSKSFWSIVKPLLLDKKNILPKELEELRKSETLLRDWEESYELIYMIYNFDYFFENILGNYKFIEK